MVSSLPRRQNISLIGLVKRPVREFPSKFVWPSSWLWLVRQSLLRYRRRRSFCGTEAICLGCAEFFSILTSLSMSDRMFWPSGARPLSRREWLTRTCNGIGSLAFAAMAAPGIGQVAEAAQASPFAPKPPHFPAKAKSCIFMYMSGGVSQVDPFDYKPTLNKMAGKRMPILPGVSGQIEALLKANNQVLPSPFEFAQFGNSGRHMNKLFE